MNKIMNDLLDHIFKHRRNYGMNEEDIEILGPNVTMPPQFFFHQNETSLRMDNLELRETDYQPLTILWISRRIHACIADCFNFFKLILYDIVTSRRYIPIIIRNCMNLPSDTIKYCKGLVISCHQTFLALKLLYQKVIGHPNMPYIYKSVMHDNSWKKLVYACCLINVPMMYYIFNACIHVQHDKTTEKSVRNKIVVITGANSGIGEQLAYEFSKRGAKVIMLSSDLTRTLQVANRIHKYMCTNSAKRRYFDEGRRKLMPNVPRFEEFEDYVHPLPHGSINVPDYVERLSHIHMDLGDVASIYRAVTSIFSCVTHIDILINNAAVNIPEEFNCFTKDGYEVNFGTNYLGHFIFTNLILGHLLRPIRRPCRIINITCTEAFTSAFTAVTAEDVENLSTSKGRFKEPYRTSKLLNYLFHLELSKRVKCPELNNKVNTYAVSPLPCRTNLNRYTEYSLIEEFIPKYEPIAGAQTILHCAMSPSAAEESGRYYQHCGRATAPVTCSSRFPSLEKLSTRLWEKTEELAKTALAKAAAKRPPTGASFYGQATFSPDEFIENYLERYKPEPKRPLREFNRYKWPFSFREKWFVDMQKRKCAIKSVQDFYEDCHGKLPHRHHRRRGFRPSICIEGLTEAKRVPLLPQTFDWMF